MNFSRRVIIDNATLSGVERITGQARVKNLSYIDNDILCLEKLLTAILFSDHLIAVDDYKDQFRSDRLKRFDYVSFTKIDNKTYLRLASDAANFAGTMSFEFNGSKPAGDVVRFFESLRIDPQLRWDVFVSSEYLALSFLVQNVKSTAYETSIDSAFRHENVDRHSILNEAAQGGNIGVAGRPDVESVKDLIRAFSSQNSQFSGGTGQQTIERMLFGYIWAAERAHFYNAVAYMEEADVHLAPLRDAFCESCCRIDYPGQVTSLLDNLKRTTYKAVSSILEPSGQANFAVRLPFFTAYLLSKSSNPQECIDLALSLRGQAEFRECRNVLNDLAEYSGSERVLKINKLLSDLEKVCDGLTRKYLVSTENGPQFSISVGLTGINLTTNLKLNGIFASYQKKPFSRLFRNIAQDLVNVERLGSLHQKVRSSIREHPDAGFTKVSATPKFMESRESDYGRPAEL